VLRGMEKKEHYILKVLDNYLDLVSTINKLSRFIPYTTIRLLTIICTVVQRSIHTVQCNILVVSVILFPLYLLFIQSRTEYDSANFSESQFKTLITYF